MGRTSKEAFTLERGACAGIPGGPSIVRAATAVETAVSAVLEYLAGVDPLGGISAPEKSKELVRP